MNITETEHVKIVAEMIEKWRGTVLTLENALAKTQESLKIYGRHLEGCRKSPCSCGFEGSIRASRGEK